MSLDKLKTLEELKRIVRSLQDSGKVVVFTNGCFDLLHRGHIRYLSQAKALGDVLVVGLNSDESVRRLKGPGRPILPVEERAEILSALAPVDYVTVFEELDPGRVIAALEPDVLVKGGDWGPDQIVGREIVQAKGGRVVSLPFGPGSSTSGIIQRILERHPKDSDPRP
ncbi:MAG: D-glycero-beta-D-manno-heptose 1-phosphate adenylyltransferase, partial [Candidatus Methylomirabilales bacterium]